MNLNYQKYLPLSKKKNCSKIIGEELGKLLEHIKRGLGLVYWITLAILVPVVLLVQRGSFENNIQLFLSIAYWLPAIGILAVISGQFDLLSSIQKGGEINIKARIYYFIHWVMLIGVNIGAWMIGGVTILWFVLQLSLLAIIGWQIGVGLKRRWKITLEEKITGITMAMAAIGLGLIAGYIRSLDQNVLGWGWGLEFTTAIVAMFIVARTIMLDIATIQIKWSGYPRSFFLKALFSNTLVLLFWLSIMLRIEGGLMDPNWWIRNAGLSFNVLVGNALFYLYYFNYEYYRKKQNP
ncbi:MAG: hypothetical protein HYW70_03080 [Candidatus Nealsonbacteria bacterium]|nr:hypothetical protein [Candidatus Nealsonbacteria bacterium]